MKSRFSLKQFLTFVFIFLVGILLLCLHHATPSATKKQSVSYTQTEFIEEIAPTIQKVAASYGVRPSIIIAQAVLESNYGTNLLAVKYHNLFVQKKLLLINHCICLQQIQLSLLNGL